MSNKRTVKGASMKAKVKTPTRVVIPVVQMTERGRRVRKFKSITAAANQTGVNSGSISKVVRGICQTAGGFRWATA